MTGPVTGLKALYTLKATLTESLGEGFGDLEYTGHSDPEFSFRTSSSAPHLCKSVKADCLPPDMWCTPYTNAEVSSDDDGDDVVTTITESTTTAFPTKTVTTTVNTSGSTVLYTDPTMEADLAYVASVQSESQATQPVVEFQHLVNSSSNAKEQPKQGSSSQAT